MKTMGRQMTKDPAKDPLASRCDEKQPSERFCEILARNYAPGTAAPGAAAPRA